MGRAGTIVYLDNNKLHDANLSVVVYYFPIIIHSAIKIGSVNIHNEKELLANAIHAMKIIANKVPGGWKNIKCFYLKTATSIALPLYQSLQFTSEKKTKAKEPLDKTAIVTKKEDGNAEKLKMKSSKVKRRGSVK